MSILTLSKHFIYGESKKIVCYNIISCQYALPIVTINKCFLKFTNLVNEFTIIYNGFTIVYNLFGVDRSKCPKHTYGICTYSNLCKSNR